MVGELSRKQIRNEESFQSNYSYHSQVNTSIEEVICSYASNQQALRITRKKVLLNISIFRNHKLEQKSNIKAFTTWKKASSKSTVLLMKENKILNIEITHYYGCEGCSL